MYRLPQIGDRPNNIVGYYRSAEATLAIAAGAPVALVMNGTNDGLDIVNASTAGAAKSTSFFIGIAPYAITAGAFGDIIISGIVTNALLTLTTRATSTDSFASVASLALGVLLNVDSVGNRLSAGATGGSSAFLPNILLAQTLASSASSASATSNTGTAVTATVKVFLRTM